MAPGTMAFKRNFVDLSSENKRFSDTDKREAENPSGEE